MIAINKNNKKRIIALTLAAGFATLALTSAGYASWQASQTITQSTNIADAIVLEYTIDGGTTWHSWDGGSVNIGLGAADGWRNFVPGTEATTSHTLFGGEDMYHQVMIRQVSTGIDTAAVHLSRTDFIASGDMYESDNPAVASVDLGYLDANPRLMPGVEYPITLSVSVPQDIDDSRKGQTGTLSLWLQTNTIA